MIEMVYVIVVQTVNMNVQNDYLNKTNDYIVKHCKTNYYNVKQIITM